MKRPRRTRCRGQAIAECVIGLVGLTIVFFGLFQIAYTGRESIVNQHQARSQADENARGNVLSIQRSYVIDWTDGPDGLRYTPDDEPAGPGRLIGGNLAGVDEINLYREEANSQLPAPGLVQMQANPAFAMQSTLPVILGNNSLAGAAEMHRGREVRTVPVQPALRYLMWPDATELTLRDDVYMPGLQIQDSP